MSRIISGLLCGILTVVGIILSTYVNNSAGNLSQDPSLFEYAFPACIIVAWAALLFNGRTSIIVRDCLVIFTFVSSLFSFHRGNLEAGLAQMLLIIPVMTFAFFISIASLLFSVGGVFTKKTATAETRNSRQIDAKTDKPSASTSVPQSQESPRPADPSDNS